MLTSFFLMIIISTSLTVRGQPLPRFHVEAWLPFRNCEMAYLVIFADFPIHPSSHKITLKMASTQVVETSVTAINSPSEDYTNQEFTNRGSVLSLYQNNLTPYMTEDIGLNFTIILAVHILIKAIIITVFINCHNQMEQS